MDPKTYKKLTHVNYGDSNSSISTAQTHAADFGEYETPFAQMHNLALHGWGVASGLEVTLSADQTGLQVAPGVAIDRNGQLIVLATGGSAVFGDTLAALDLPQSELKSPVTVPAAGQLGKKVVLGVQFHDKLRAIPPAAGDFPAGKLEQTPWLRLLPAQGFQDSTDLIVLAIADVGNDGKVTGVVSAAPGGAPVRQRLSTSVGELKIERPSPDTATAVTVASLGVSAAGAGQIQVQTRAGLPAVVLTTSGNADDGLIRVVSNAQDVVTLGPGGVSTTAAISVRGNLAALGGITVTGNITATGSITTGGGIAATGAISTLAGLTAHAGFTTAGVTVSSGGLASPAGLWCGPAWAQGTASGNVWCGSVIGQGWSVSSGGIVGNGWSAGTGGFTTNGGLSAKGFISTDKVLTAVGGVVGKAGLWTDRQVNAGDWIHSGGGYQVDVGGRAKAVLTKDATNGGRLALWNNAGKEVATIWITATGYGVIAVRDANGQNGHWLDASGPKSFVMTHPKDASKDIVYGCIEGPEAGAYIRGRAALKNGAARVELPDHFLLVVNPESLTVQLTPRSALSKGLAVVESGPAGFTVQELLEGKGSYEFDYFVCGTRVGYEHYQPVVSKGNSPMGHQLYALAESATMVAALAAPAPPTPQPTDLPEVTVVQIMPPPAPSSSVDPKAQS